MSTVLFLAPSCKKCDRDQMQNQALTQTVTASIDENTSYTFEVPASNNHNPFQIATQAANFKVSQISTTASGGAVYQYTPALNFVGNDQVALTNLPAAAVLPVTAPNGGCPQGGSNQCNQSNHHCDHGHDHDKDDMSSMTITINITVKSTTGVTSSNPLNNY
jgi:hypothetical protein